MTRVKDYGIRLAKGSENPRKLVANPATKAAVPRIQYDRFCRNGKHPSAHLWNQLNESTNQSVLYRTREVFRAPGWVGAGGGQGSGGTRTRYRFAFRTGPYSHALRCVAVTIPQSAGLTGNSYSTLTIYSDTAEATAVATATFYHGVNPGGSLIASEGLPYLKPVTITISGLSADTDYYAKVGDVAEGRILSLCVFDLASMTQNGGYLAQNISAETDIYDVYREYTATIQENLAKRTGGLALHYATDLDSQPATNATATSKNIADNSTTFTDASRGFKIDMTNRDRLSQTTGVPVVMKAFCGTTSATNKGRIRLMSSAGSAIMTITDGVPTTPPDSQRAWISATGFLPATADKYDLHFDNNGDGTLSVLAVSIYEYEA